MPRTFWAPIALALAGLLGGSRSSHAFDLYYTNFSNPRQQLIINEHGISAGGPLASAEYCPETSAFSCFSSGGLKFAVPKKLANQRSWKHDGVAYRILERTKLAIVGVPVEVAFIEQVSQGAKIVFVYSEFRGLLALSSSGRAARVFVLENSCGFGASESCK